jgi:DNA-binding MarR family transcriptional regulator
MMSRGQIQEPEAVADSASRLAELVVRTSRRLHQSSMAELGPIGLSHGQARLMRILAEAPQAMRMVDVAAALEVVPRTATTMVDGLETAGLVKRAADPSDRRAVLVELAQPGRDLLERIGQARRRTAELVFGRLADNERAELARLLDLVCCGGCPAGRQRAERANGRSRR